MWPTWFIPGITRVEHIAGERCGASITFDLDVDFPDVEVGDYILYFVRMNGNPTGATSLPGGSTPARFIQQPTGLRPLWWEPASLAAKPINNGAGSCPASIWACVYAGFVTDTTADMTFTRNHTTYGLCGFAVQYFNVSKMIPADYVNVAWSRYNSGSNAGQLFPPIGIHDEAQGRMFWAMCNEVRASATDFPGSFRGDRTLRNDYLYEAYASTLDSGNSTAPIWKAWTEYVDLTDVNANMVPWTPPHVIGDTHALTGWSYHSASAATIDFGTNFGHGVAAQVGVSDLHYAYTTVSLTAGEWYFFAAKSWGDTTPSCQPWMSVVDPSSNEFGYGFKADATPGFYLSSTIGAGAAFPFTIIQDVDGLPSTFVGVGGFAFQAPETGTYEVRLGVANTAGTRTWSPASAVAQYWGDVAFTKGRLPTGRDHNGSQAWGPKVPTGGYDTVGASGIHNISAVGLSIRTAGSPIRKVSFSPSSTRQFPGQGAQPRWADGNFASITGGDWPGGIPQDGQVMLADRWVFPTYRTSEDAGSDTTGKYYFEYSASGGSSGNWGIGVAYTAATLQEAEPVAGGVAAEWNNAGGFTVPNGATRTGTPGTFTVSDVVSCSVDYSDHTVRFYKNGTENWRFSMPTAWTDGGDIPIRAVLIHGFGSGRSIVPNMTGPFSHKPSGFVAYDWANEA